jgi:CubicO group peptidase (beta-lactamase class C family)
MAAGSDEIAVPDPERAGLDPARLARVDEAIRRELARGEFSAITLAVGRHGTLAHERYFGTTRYDGGEPVTERSLLPIASVSKPVAATAIMLLIERGHFQLATPVAELVPEFGRNGKRSVTVGHLLTHTAGLNEQFIDGVPFSTREAYFERLHQSQLLWPPGSHVAYSSAGFSALGEVIEHTTGAPAARFLAEELFGPLGMRDTFLSPPEEHRGRIVECTRPNGEDMVQELLNSGGLAGSIFSTVRDLLRFGSLFLAGGRVPGPSGGQLLSPASVAAMLIDRTAHLPFVRPGGAPGEAYHGGLGWMLAAPTLWMCDLASPRAFGHTGSSGAFLVVDPTYDLVAALLANRWGGKWMWMVEVMNAVWASLVAD